jgi:hypothetical protein
MISVAMYSLDEFTHTIRWLAHAVSLKNDYVQANNNLKHVDRRRYPNNIHVDIANTLNSFRLIRRLDQLQLVPM